MLAPTSHILSLQEISVNKVDDGDNICVLFPNVFVFTLFANDNS